MKKYIVNIIFSGNLSIPIKAKNDDEAEEKGFNIDSIDFIKLFKKYGDLVDFELTEVEEIEIKAVIA